MQQLEEDQRVLQTEVMRSGDSSCNLPVNLRRLIENAQRKFGCKLHKRGPTGACTLRTALHCIALHSRLLHPPASPSTLLPRRNTSEQLSQPLHCQALTCHAVLRLSAAAALQT